MTLTDQTKCEKHGYPQYFGEPCLKCHQEQWATETRSGEPFLVSLAGAALCVLVILALMVWR